MPGSKLEKLWEVIQISTSIEYPYLDFTGDKIDPFWIEDMSGLTKLMMRGCGKLASKSYKLKCILEVDFSDCKVVTAFSDASVVTRIADDQLPVTEEASFRLGNLTVCAKNCESLSSTSHCFLNPMICLKYYNCFNVGRHVQKLILESDFKYAVLPGGKVPKYFRHRAIGNSLTISLPESSLYQNVLRFKACIMLTDHPKDRSAEIWVRWYCRGKSNIHYVYIDVVDSFNMDHLVVFHSEFCPSKAVFGHPYELDYNYVRFKFEYHGNACSCIKFGFTPTRKLVTCRPSG